MPVVLRPFNLRRYSSVVLFVLALSVRLGYVFAGPVYSWLVYSDCAGYWLRAQILLAGRGSEYGEWACWPVATHFLLAGLFGVLRFLHVPLVSWLACSLVAFALLGSVSVVWLRGLVSSLFPQRGAGLLAAVLYAFCWPMIYMTQFILSENIAVPAVIGGLYYSLGASVSRRLVGGFLLGLAGAVRPSFLVLVPIVLLFAWGRGKHFDRAKDIFCGLAVPVLFFLFYTATISGGRVWGLAANGGLNFAIAQGQLGSVTNSHYYIVDGLPYTFQVGVPEFINKPGYPRLVTHRPFYDQAFYYSLGRAFFPRSLVTDLRAVPSLWLGSQFPAAKTLWYEPMQGFSTVLCGWVALACLVVVPLIGWFRPLSRAVWLLWAVAASPVPVGLLYGCERRFSYAVQFAVISLVGVASVQAWAALRRWQFSEGHTVKQEILTGV